jgi:dipeptidase D
MLLAPNGLIGLSADYPDTVETSTNMGVVKQSAGSIEFIFENRSFIPSKLCYLNKRIGKLAALTNMECEHKFRYPEWNYDKKSSLLKLYQSVYSNLYGSTAEAAVLHAGLECGYIKNRIPDMEIISIGPNITGAHSPDERLDLDSCDKIWTLIVQLIAALI